MRKISRQFPKMIKRALKEKNSTQKETFSTWEEPLEFGTVKVQDFPLEALPKKLKWVFMSQFGWLPSRSQIDETIETLQRKHPAMKRWRCHDLRHSFSFNFLKRRGDIYALKDILGHAKIELTIDLYGHLTSEHVQNVSPYD